MAELRTPTGKDSVYDDDVVLSGVVLSERAADDPLCVLCAYPVKAFRNTRR